MNKTYMILFVMVLLVCSFVSANLNSGLVAYYNFNQTGNLTDQVFGIMNSSSDTVESKTATGINNNAWEFVAVNDDKVDMMPTNLGSMGGANPRTVNVWVKIDDVSTYDVVFSYGASGTGEEMSAAFRTDNLLSLWGSSADSPDISFTTVGGVWYMFTAIYNGTYGFLYVNGTNMWNGSLTWNTATTSFVIGDRITNPGSSANYDGVIDEMGMWNRTLTDNELLELYNNGVGKFPPFVEEEETSPPTIVPPSPTDNTHNNTNVTLNVSHSTAQNDVRYYLYFGTGSNLTEADLYLNNVTRNASEWRSFYTNVSDGTYYWKWKVQNITNGLFSANTTQRNWTLDTVNPTITLISNNGFKADNSTIINSYLNNLTINISFFDINLYQTLINITNSTGSSVYNYTNVSITQTTDNISKTIDISGWTLGNYTIQLATTDSHTAKYIPGYDTSKGLNYLRYKTTEGNDIRITSDTLPLTFSTTKLTDKYDFEFNYLFLREEYKYTITSRNRIDYIEDSDYKAHFVIMGENGRGNWLDFENEYLSKKDYKVIKISDYEYEVIIKSKGRKQIKFSSLGGLNTVEVHYLLRLGAVLDVWVYDEENYPVQINAIVTIGTQSANSSINISGARLVNITKDITSLTLVSSGFGTEEKTISVTSNYHNLSFNMTPVNAVRLYFYDEKSNDLITGETFSVYLETTGFSQTYSTSDNPYLITGLSSGLYELKASSANYPSREYVGLNINNVTITNLNIYLINSTDSSEITFNIVGGSLNPLEDVFVVFTRIINGTITVVAEEESNFAGQVKLYLDENYEYTINFSKTGYEDKEISLEPTDSEYLIQMVSTVGAYEISVHEGIRYRFEPSNLVLNNNTKYNFTFTLNSTVWNVTGCTLNLWNGSILLDTTSSYISTSCYLRIEQDTLSMTNITSEAIYELDSTYNFTVSQQYSVIYTYQGEFSLMSFLDELTDFSMAGFDSFGRMILAFIVIFVIMGMASIKVGFENKEILLFMLWGLVGFFSFIGWFTLTLSTMPNFLGLRKWFMFYLVSLMVIGFIVDKVRK